MEAEKTQTQHMYVCMYDKKKEDILNIRPHEDWNIIFSSSLSNGHTIRCQNDKCKIVFFQSLHVCFTSLSSCCLCILVSNTDFIWVNCSYYTKNKTKTHQIIVSIWKAKTVTRLQCTLGSRSLRRLVKWMLK